MLSYMFQYESQRENKDLSSLLSQQHSFIAIYLISPRLSFMVETHWDHHNNCLTLKIKSEKNIAFFSVEFFAFVSNISFTVIRTRTFLASMPDPEVIKLFSRSTQMSTKFQLLIKTKIPTNKEVTSFKSLRCCIYPAH